MLEQAIANILETNVNMESINKEKEVRKEKKWKF